MRSLMKDSFTTPREIVQLNIEHYSKLLQSSLDEQTRLAVEGLLAAEKAKLAKLAAKASKDAPDSCHGTE
jgi:hypothetical protein